MRVIGSTIKQMDTVYTIILMAQCMKAIGVMTYNMAQVKKAGRMAQFTKVSIWRARNMEWASIAGTMDQNIRVNGTKIK